MLTFLAISYIDTVAKIVGIKFIDSKSSFDVNE
jgi:hypothetical protein